MATSGNGITASNCLLSGPFPPPRPVKREKKNRTPGTPADRFQGRVASASPPGTGQRQVKAQRNATNAPAQGARRTPIDASLTGWSGLESTRVMPRAGCHAPALRCVRACLLSPARGRGGALRPTCNQKWPRRLRTCTERHGKARQGKAYYTPTRSLPPT